MKKLCSLLILAMTFAVLCDRAMAWSNPGHMMVALVAYENLEPATKARVDELIARNPMIDDWRELIPAGTSADDAKKMLFMIAATWPDQIKGSGDYHDDGVMENGKLNSNRPPTDGTAGRNTGYDDKARHKYWHFVDLPFSPDGTALAQPPTPNANTQISTFIMVLASSAKDDLKSYDLVWLLHLVGDVHQPLHGAQRFTKTQKKGDDGGNKVTVHNCVSNKCRDQALHSFWDGLYGSTIELKPSLALAFKAVKANKIKAATGAAAGNQNVSGWISESFDLAKAVVYKNPPIGNGNSPFPVTEKYRTAALLTANMRISLAGARLANILNKHLS